MRHHRPHPHGDRSNRGSAGPDCSGPHGIIRGWLRRLAARRKAGAVLALGLVILSIAPLLADPLDSWQVRSPSPAGESYFYGDGQWIGLYARGISGGIIHSADAVSWSDSSIPPDFYPSGADYANGLWVAFGRERAGFGAMLTSTDGKVWEKQTSGLDLFRSLGIDFAPVGAAYGDGLWMVMGLRGQYLTSPDGVLWTPGGFDAAGDIVSISYGNGRWLALLNSYRAYVSTNGTDWTEHPLPAEIFEIKRAKFGGGQWMAIARNSSSEVLISSTNGVVWATRHVISGSGRYWQIEFGDGRWLVAGVEDPDPETFAYPLVTLTSADGATWERLVVARPYDRREFGIVGGNLCYGGGQWLMSGNEGGQGVGRQLLASTNAVDWASRVERVTDGYMSGLAHAAGQWTAVGWPFDPENKPDFVIATSFDGRHWTKGSASGGGTLTSVAYGDGRWMATGFRYNLPLPYSGVILTSTNGSEWSSTLEGPPESEFGGSAYGNGLWVAVGSNQSGPVLVTSSDGLTWTPRPLPVATGGVGIVRFANGRWMVLGRGASGGFVLTSTDGITWFEAAGIAEASDVHFGDGMWIALTDRLHPDGFRRPTTLRSANGTDWTMRDLGVEFTSNSGLTSIIHVAGRWMIKENNTRLWSSEDGEEWTEHLTGFDGGALRSDGRRVLLFDSEALRASGRLTPARPPSVSIVREGPEIALWVGGEIGERYEIEQSLDLDAAGWALLQEITLATDPQRVGINLSAGNRGFWRARAPAN